MTIEHALDKCRGERDALKKENEELVEALKALLKDTNIQGAGWASVYKAEQVLNDLERG